MAMIGTRVMRTEDPDLVTGRGTFVDNLVLPDAAHVVYVRSTIAHARIVSIDVSTARTMPGVLGIFTATDLEAAGVGPMPKDSPLLPVDVGRRALATDTVRFVGEVIAAVVADTRARAVDAAEMVEVEYDPLPILVDPEEAIDSTTLLFSDRDSNVVMSLPARHSVDFSQCEVIVEQRMLNRRIAPSPLEPRVAASRWEAPDENGVRRLTHWQACQGAHPIRAQLAGFHGIPEEQIRVITPDVGGGFGAKAFFYPEDMLLPWLARLVDRPVRYSESRTESMSGLGHGRAQIQDVRIGGTRDGRILAYELNVIQDAGAYPRFGTFLPFMTGEIGRAHV